MTSNGHNNKTLNQKYTGKIDTVFKYKILSGRNEKHVLTTPHEHKSYTKKMVRNGTSRT